MVDVPVRGLAVLLAIALLGGGCRDDRPSTAPAPDGYTTTTCHPRGGTTVTLALPAGADTTHDACSWSVPRAGTHGRPVSVTVTWVGEGDDASLRAERDDQSEFLGVEGDDEVTGLRFDEGVAVFGTTGDRLRYQCYCDGLPQLDYLAQADGVRLAASVVDPRARVQVEELLDDVLPTVRVTA